MPAHFNDFSGDAYTGDYLSPLEGRNMFALMQSARLESLHLSVDPVTGLKAVIAIHNSQFGPALGGCRYLAYPDDESAINDAIRLAQDMSYKAVLAGLAAGGGQAVIMRAPHVESRAALFEAFGRCVEQLDGRYITAIDNGRHGLHRPIHPTRHQHHCGGRSLASCRDGGVRGHSQHGVMATGQR